MARSFFAILLLCSAAICSAAEPVQLFTQEDLARLRASNPNHFARATQLIAAANRYCPLHPPEAQSAEARADQLKCGDLEKTSNPPKRQIEFTLDRTRYVALVTLTADPPALSPAKP